MTSWYSTRSAIIQKALAVSWPQFKTTWTQTHNPSTASSAHPSGKSPQKDPLGEERSPLLKSHQLPAAPGVCAGWWSARKEGTALCAHTATSFPKSHLWGLKHSEKLSAGEQGWQRGHWQALEMGQSPKMGCRLVWQEQAARQPSCPISWRLLPAGWVSQLGLIWFIGMVTQAERKMGREGGLR